MTHDRDIGEIYRQKNLPIRKTSWPRVSPEERDSLNPADLDEGADPLLHRLGTNHEHPGDHRTYQRILDMQITFSDWYFQYNQDLEMSDPNGNELRAIQRLINESKLFRRLILHLDRRDDEIIRNRSNQPLRRWFE